MFDTLARMGASAAGAYEIERSLRFNSDDSTYLRKTDFSGDPDSGTTFTFSAWVKRGDSGWFPIFGSWSGTLAYNTFGFSSNDRLGWWIRNSSNSYLTRKESQALYKDYSSWYHVVLQRNSTLATAADRQKLWVNGEQITDWDDDNNDNEDLTYSSDFLTDLNIGRVNIGSSSYKYADGYLAEVYYIDGQALPASNFGETDSDTGQWIPKKYEGTYGSNGIYLNFSDNSGTSATTLGKDSSGNGNNFTPNNFSVSAGAGNDSVEDTPTNNYCTLNLLTNNMGASSDASVTNGLLKWVGTSNNDNIVATQAVSSGKWYYELVVGSNADKLVAGWTTTDETTNYNESGLIYYNSIGIRQGDKTVSWDSTVTSSLTFATDDVIGFALNLADNELKVYENNSLVSTITVPTDKGSTWIPCCGDSSSTDASATFNFGQQGFTHTPPTGFKALCTKNLPTPTIKKGTDYFDTAIWTGDNTSNRVISLDFQPDLIWIKQRNDTRVHIIQDSVRGFTKGLETNSSDDEVTRDPPYGEGVAGGFEVDTTAGSNVSGRDMVAWNWKESATAGFDIVSFTPSSGTNTYSHGLGVKPDFILFKSRESTANWDVYNATLTADYKLYLNGPDLKIDSGFMSDTEPTSSVFSFNPGNQDGNVHLAYCFANVEGYSKAGKYTGNGVTDGPFIYTGFKPAYLLTKRTEVGGGQDWEVLDTARNPYNQVSTRLIPNESYHEGELSAKNMEFVSNGYKIRTNSSGVNSDGIEYIYLAFAETPFKYATAR